MLTKYILLLLPISSLASAIEAEIAPPDLRGVYVSKCEVGGFDDISPLTSDSRVTFLSATKFKSEVRYYRDSECAVPVENYPDSSTLIGTYAIGRPTGVIKPRGQLFELTIKWEGQTYKTNFDLDRFEDGKVLLNFDDRRPEGKVVSYIKVENLE